jgi:hypothetical protein
MPSSTQSTTPNVVLDGKTLDAATVIAQRAARRARGRVAKTLLTVLVVGLIAIFAMSFWISRNASAEPALAFFLLLAALLFIVVFFANTLWQWRILRIFDLRCPHCAQPLGGDSQWTKRPGYTCPHCGKDALATARQLGDG